MLHPKDGKRRAVTAPRAYNVLFLCTGNSARSILAEAILSRIGAGKFNAFSAGSHPKGAPHPQAIALLRRLSFSVEGLRSKSWDAFAAPSAPALDFVFTVCDNAAGEICPIWPGQPISAHWGVYDPAAVEGASAEIAAAFADVYGRLHNRVEALVNLPIQSLDRLTLQTRLAAIGRAGADIAPHAVS